MTIALYIETLVQEGKPVAKVVASDSFEFSGSELATSHGVILFERRAFESGDVCEFYDASGSIVARARGFLTVE